MAVPSSFLVAEAAAVAAPSGMAIVLSRGSATTPYAFGLLRDARPSQRPHPYRIASSDFINHQAWHCTASFRALIVIGVAAAFGAVCTQSSAFGLRQREEHRVAALPALSMNRSKEVYGSSQQCGLDDNGVRFTAVKEVDVSVSLRPSFMWAQVGTTF